MLFFIYMGLVFIYLFYTFICPIRVLLYGFIVIIIIIIIIVIFGVWFYLSYAFYYYYYYLGVLIFDVTREHDMNPI